MQDNCSDYCSGCPACKPESESCPCACHENKLKRPYKHDTKCCDNMNGTVEPDQQEERCTRCDGPFLHHHHKHITRKGIYHTKCYKKRGEQIKRDTKIAEDNLPDRRDLVELDCDQQEERECKACYGKGWHSQIIREQGSGDFIGDKDYDSGHHEVKNTCSRCKGSGKEPKPPTEEEERPKHHPRNPPCGYLSCTVCNSYKPPTRLEEIREKVNEYCRESNTAPFGSETSQAMQDVFYLLSKIDELEGALREICELNRTIGNHCEDDCIAGKVLAKLDD